MLREISQARGDRGKDVMAELLGAAAALAAVAALVGLALFVISLATLAVMGTIAAVTVWPPRRGSARADPPRRAV